MTRKRLPPDTRPKWNDPNLPFTNAKGVAIPADKATKLFEQKLSLAADPPYTQDPTYNLKRKRRP